MNERSLVVLELPKILTRLATHTAFSVSRELALRLLPADNFADADLRLRETSESRKLLSLKPQASVRGARDIRPTVQRAVMGGSLDPGQLLEIASTTQAAKTVRATISSSGLRFGALEDITSRMSFFDGLEREIARCIDDQGRVADNASTRLERLRSSLRSERDRLVKRLDEIVNSPAYRTMLQEAIVTQRDGRYVVPVKAEFKGSFRGIVHDQSASGATVFVEPMATVTQNNRIRELELEERAEVERILAQISTLVAAHADALNATVEALADLDLTLAKARFANEIRASEPVLLPLESLPAGESPIMLRAARHPLLGEHVVPISVHLGGAFNVLVITGPNTGGKTVTLKTVGLLTLMAQAGLHIPAADGSRLAVFQEVFADIGDEQSIEQSLSTFSSHMRTVATVLARADRRSLVLLDELGAGTDPAEGSALAQAILDFLLARNALVIATTHYSELKAYAHLTDRVENASVEFDLATMAPTYHLRIGVPGPSNALAIAERLHIPPEIVASARQKMNPDEVAVEKLLAELHLERERAIAQRKSAEERAELAEQTRANLAKQQAEIERSRKEAVSLVKEQARLEAAEEIARVRDKLRQTLADVEPDTGNRGTLLARLREVQRMERQIESPAEEMPPQTVADVIAEPSPGRIRAGDTVLVAGLNQQGEVISLVDRDSAEVQVGSFKLRVELRGLRRLRAHDRQQEAPTLHLERRDPVPMQIEVRGWRAEDVPPVVDKYIQDAYLAGLSSVRIVHGKGTGVLRRLVRDQLSAHPLVRACRQPEARDGGEGVTIVDLAM